MNKYTELRYNLIKLRAEQRDLNLCLKKESQKQVPDHFLMKYYRKRNLQIKEQLLTIEMEKIKFDIGNRWAPKII